MAGGEYCQRGVAMPRRRMLDPSFFDDAYVANLTAYERLFLLGCLRNADDEGRLKGHHAYLKAEIFMYDDDITLERMKEMKDSTLEKMAEWPEDNIWRLCPYNNGGSDYLYFPNWYEQQKPSHPSPSKLPAPPEGISRKPLTNLSTPSGVAPEAVKSPSALVKVSQVKDSIGQSSLVEVHEDFRKFSTNESDLTDFLTKTMKKYISAGRQRALAAVAEGGGASTGELPPDKEAFTRGQWGIIVLEAFWKQMVGAALSRGLWNAGHEALKKHPVEVVARAFVKAGRYEGGKHKSAKYIETIISELTGQEHNRSP